jgi:regulator of protease activity HflC (stomatin/prohibitin superfamily)
MVFLRYLLFWGGAGLIAAAVAILAHDFYLGARRKQSLATAGAVPAPELPGIHWHWRNAIVLALLGWVPILLSYGIVVVPSGTAGVLVSQTSGSLPGTLYPGAHFVIPLADNVVLFDTRDQLFTTGELENSAKEAKQFGGAEPLRVQAKEGLIIGLAITVRYRLDPKHLDYIQSNLPQPVEKEIVPPVVASAWRELVPNYTVRDVFATKREEIRQKAADQITQKLAADGIVVKEVMLRDIQLPPEYAKGLESLLLKEQQNDQMGVQTEIQEKQVRISELEAEATKAQQVKQAEGDAQVKVLQAKAEADAMQYTLPLKQKQIEESKLEAEARKEATVENAEANAQATVKNAEAMAQAKVLDSKAEMERRKLLAEAEADRIRVTAVADAERMRNEGAILKGNPLLINKIIAEKLSDKLQIMMVPSDGKFFFANDVLKSMNMSNRGSEADQAEELEK